MSGSDGSLLGVVVLARHGDRQGFYQSPTSYTASQTAITPLGNEQALQLGQKLRSLYLNASSPLHVSGVTSPVANISQLVVRADAGGEGGVIWNSALSVLQGLFPGTADYNTSLANGTDVSGPLGGYQYIPIESVEPDNDVSLEGWTACGAFDNSTKAFYNSAEFKQKASDHSTFLNSLPQYLDGRNVTLENMWNIFDFMNVQSIHNEQFSKALPPTYLAQARDLANYHEYGVFSSPQLNGIANIAGRAILPSVVGDLKNIANSSNPVKFAYTSISYKPFLSLFNMTQAAQQNPQLAGIVNYVAAVAFELRQPSSGEPVIRFKFKNGTDDNDFKTLNFMNANGDVPLSTFVNYLSPTMINDTSDWCSACSNSQDRGCAALAAASASGEASSNGGGHHEMSPVGAGFLGAGLAIAVMLMCFGVLLFLGILVIGRPKKKGQETKA